LRRREGTLPDGFDGFEPVDEPIHHDETGLVPAGDWDAGDDEDG